MTRQINRLFPSVWLIIFIYARQPKTTTFLMKNCLTVFEIKLQAIYNTVLIRWTFIFIFTANSSSTYIYSNGEGLENNTEVILRKFRDPCLLNVSLTLELSFCVKNGKPRKLHRNCLLHNNYSWLNIVSNRKWRFYSAHALSSVMSFMTSFYSFQNVSHNM